MSQKTIRAPIQLRGVGLHSGRPVHMRLIPAQANAGIRFIRKDLTGHNEIKAVPEVVDRTPLCTRLVAPGRSGLSVSTVEHLMAALYASEIDNLRIEIDGPEAPILDGSSAPFVQAVRQVGVKDLGAPRRVLRMLKPVRVGEGERWAEIRPAQRPGLHIEAAIDFPVAAIGRQSFSARITTDLFETDLAQARTFCIAGDIEKMRANGLALGGSLDNAVVFNHDGVDNDNGLRFADEPVRHKVLDLIGDIALFGCRIEGLIRASRPGHALTNDLLRALADTPSAWECSDGASSVAAKALASQDCSSEMLPLAV